eukprot:813952_1
MHGPLITSLLMLISLPATADLLTDMSNIVTDLPATLTSIQRDITDMVDYIGRVGNLTFNPPKVHFANPTLPKYVTMTKECIEALPTPENTFFEPPPIIDQIVTFGSDVVFEIIANVMVTLGQEDALQKCSDAAPQLKKMLMGNPSSRRRLLNTVKVDWKIVNAVLKLLKEPGDFVCEVIDDTLGAELGKTAVASPLCKALMHGLQIAILTIESLLQQWDSEAGEKKHRELKS